MAGLHPVSNPPNPWRTDHVEWLEEIPEARLEVFEERAKSILSKNDSPDLPFRWSVNPYRGCFHGCAYCYARPSHQYWQWGAGSDFERKIVVKTNAAELLKQTFERASWQGERIVISGNTDPYQPLEASYGITRDCLGVCLRYRNPVTIITKGAVIRRDAELLGELARYASVRVFVSIAFADDHHRAMLEPWAPPITRRFEVLRTLSEAGVPTGVSLSPLIPGLNESAVAEVLQRARDAGADRAFMTLLRLPGPVLDIFKTRMSETLPLRAERVMHALAEFRPDGLQEIRFGKRMRGQGERWEMVQKLFAHQCKKLGFGTGEREVFKDTFERPGTQLGLGFDAK